MTGSGADPDEWVGSCHCGAVRITLTRAPDQVTHCNCSMCTKSGFQGVYFSGDDVRVEGGPLEPYVRADIDEQCLTLWRCARCGVVTHWTPLTPPPHERIGVNSRLFDPAKIAALPVRTVDGASW